MERGRVVTLKNLFWFVFRGCFWYLFDVGWISWGNTLGKTFLTPKGNQRVFLPFTILESQYPRYDRAPCNPVGENSQNSSLWAITKAVLFRVAKRVWNFSHDPGSVLIINIEYGTMSLGCKIYWCG